MKTYKAGKFTAEVSDPSPMWITLKGINPNGEHIELRFDPSDAPDLRHVLNRAIIHVERNDPKGMT